MDMCCIHTCTNSIMNVIIMYHKYVLMKVFKNKIKIYPCLIVHWSLRNWPITEWNFKKQAHWEAYSWYWDNANVRSQSEHVPQREFFNYALAKRQYEADVLVKSVRCSAKMQALLTPSAREVINTRHLPIISAFRRLRQEDCLPVEASRVFRSGALLVC